MARLIISAHALTQLYKLTFRITGSLNDKAEAERVAKGPVIETSLAVLLANQQNRISATNLLPHRS